MGGWEAHSDLSLSLPGRACTTLKTEMNLKLAYSGLAGAACHMASVRGWRSKVEVEGVCGICPWPCLNPVPKGAHEAPMPLASTHGPVVIHPWLPVGCVAEHDRLIDWRHRACATQPDEADRHHHHTQARPERHEAGAVYSPVPTEPRLMEDSQPLEDVALNGDGRAVDEPLIDATKALPRVRHVEPFRKAPWSSHPWLEAVGAQEEAIDACEDASGEDALAAPSASGLVLLEGEKSLIEREEAQSCPLHFGLSGPPPRAGPLECPLSRAAITLVSRAAITLMIITLVGRGTCRGAVLCLLVAGP